MAYMVYLQLAENVLAEQRKVRIKDVSKVVADNPDLKNKIEKLVLMNFSTGSKGQQVISILDIIEEIKKNCDEEVSITNLGQPNVVVYYKAFDPSDRIKQTFKFILLCLIAFFGAGFQSGYLSESSYFLITEPIRNSRMIRHRFRSRCANMNRK